MELTTVTWNIGGARLLKSGEDPKVMSSYSEPGLEEIALWLQESDPEIVFLQEVEGDDYSNQVEYIAQKADYPYFFYDPMSPSHLNTSQKLGNGVLSKFPYSEHTSSVFNNPGISFSLEGTVVESHDKGYSSCLINTGNAAVRAVTLHLLPLKKMGVSLSSSTAKTIYSDVASRLQFTDSHVLIQGDFNIDNPTVADTIPRLFSDTALEEVVVSAPTTPKGRTYDHSLYKGFNLQSFIVDSSVKTDHYPLICNFNFSQ